jgi:hypothetical protein
MPRVVFHGFDSAGTQANGLGLSTIDGPVDVTRYVSRLSWTHSVREPWETIEISMSIPQSQIQTVLPGPPVGSAGISGDGTVRQPSTGFWVVLYSPNEDRKGEEIWSAVQWGICARLRLTGEVEQSTGGQHVRVTVSCESWVSLLRRNTICMAPGSSWIRDGYSYDLRQWGDELSALLQGSLNKMPGAVFADLYRSMTPQLIPTTLSAFDGTFTTWNEDGRAKYEFGDFLQAQLTPEELVDIGITDLNAATVTSRAYAIRDSIELVWNRELCQRHAPLRSLNHKAVTGWGMGSIGSPLPRGTTWSYWQSSFFPVAEIECFPSMEWPLYGVSPFYSALWTDTVEAAQAYAEAAAGLTVGTGTYWYETTLEELEATPDWSKEGLEFATLTESRDELVPRAGYLSEALGGSSPVLIYRMKPTLFQPLNALELTDQARRRWGPEITLDDPSTAELYYSIESAPTASEKVGLNQRTQAVSPRANIEKDLWNDWTADQVYSFDVSFDESSRVNALYAKTPFQPQSQMELHGLLGHPIVDDSDVGKHGLRLKTVDWPFLPPSVEIEFEFEGETFRYAGTLQNRLTAQGEELWAASANSDTTWIYGRGSMRGVYKPWAKAGYWIRLAWSGSWIPYSASPESEGNPAELGDTPGWTGYAHTVSHEVQVDSSTGAVRASTTVQLDRLSMARGAGEVPSVSSLPTNAHVSDGRAFIVNDQGQRVTGSIQVNDDGTIEFVPDPVPG